uniref:Uncharacterized protein n=1 Tax=Anopheles farauti TaxID=69004 RepID=A0A182QCD6_9DIPT
MKPAAARTGADERPLRVVAELVPFQVLLALQSSATDITYESPLDLVHHQMLLEALLLRVGHVTLRAAEQYRPIDGGRYVHLARFLALRFRWFRFVLAFLSRLPAGRRAIVARTIVSDLARLKFTLSSTVDTCSSSSSSSSSSATSVRRTDTGTVFRLTGAIRRSEFHKSNMHSSTGGRQ